MNFKKGLKDNIKINNTNDKKNFVPAIQKLVQLSINITFKTLNIYVNAENFTMPACNFLCSRP
jgi:hypothetical protein